jgi:hypothetical protein
MFINLLKAASNFTYNQVLTFNNSAGWLHSMYVFSEQTETFALCNINSLVFITELESVYSAVRNASFYDVYISSWKS